MAEKNFAFASEKISIAFYSLAGLGDAVIARKVLEALIELAPDCLVDFFAVTEGHKSFAKAFYGDIKNLNLILSYQKFYGENKQKYDAALCVGGCHVVLLENVNVNRLSVTAPALLESFVKLSDYNKRNVFPYGPWRTSVALRNMIAAPILNKNCYEFLSCDGALPIRDNKIKIPLLPAYEEKFNRLKLGKYITFYTNISEHERARPKVKSWSVRNFSEYISHMKKNFPDVEIVQVDGAGSVKVESADRHFLGEDLELTKYILANSLLHVGGEGGLIHLATAVGTKCLVLFGPSDRNYSGYDWNINLVSEVCRPCSYTNGEDWWSCLRGNVEPPCMLNHTPQTVCAVTCNYLKNNA